MKSLMIQKGTFVYKGVHIMCDTSVIYSLCLCSGPNTHIHIYFVIVYI